MSKDETMNATRQVLTALFSMMTVLIPTLATSKNFSLLTTGILAAVPAIATLGSIGWSMAAHWQKKVVPVSATALALPTPPLPKGTLVDLTPMHGLAKVVG